MDFLEMLRMRGGYWKYNGGRYLAELTSGKVSDVYCDCSKITSRPIDLEIAALNLIYKYAEQVCPDHEANPFYCDFGEKPVRGTCIADLLPERHEYVGDIIPHFTENLVGNLLWEDQNALTQKNLYVCGPAMGGITLSCMIARILAGTAIFTEPVYGIEHREKRVHPDDIENAVKGLVRGEYKGGLLDANVGNWTMNAETAAAEGFKAVKTGQQLKRFEIPEGATVLFVEDVITTGKNTREMISAVLGTYPDKCPNVNVLPYVLCLVNRSQKQVVAFDRSVRGESGGVLEWRSFQIISLADVQARTWDTLNDAREEGYIVKCSECDGVGGDCPHCCNGSVGVEAVRPKENWDKLTKGA